MQGFLKMDTSYLHPNVTTSLHPSNTTVTVHADYSDERVTASWVQFVFYQVLGFPISILGIFGNILSIFVWTRREMHWGSSSTSCYLVALACFDMAYLFIINFGVLLAYTWKRIENGTPTPLYPYKDYTEDIAKVTRPLTDVIANTTLYLVVAFTTERFIAITYPMKRRSLCTPKRARYVIIAIIVVVILLHIPEFLEVHPAMKDNGFADSVWYKIGYNWLIFVMLFAVLPLVVLCVFNIMLIRKVIISKRRRVIMTYQSGQSDKGFGVLTLTIIMVVLIAFICHIPSAIMLCIYTYKEHNSHLSLGQKQKWETAFAAGNFLYLCNSSVNFILYSAFSAKFRHTCKRLICPCFKDEVMQSGNHTEAEVIDDKSTHNGNAEPLLKTNKTNFH